MDTFDGKVASTFSKNAREEVRAYFQQYGEEMLAHIRVFRMDKNGVLRPTKKGIAVHPEELEKLVLAAVALLAEAARTQQ